MSESITLNRKQIREMQSEIGKDAVTLCAMVSERTGGLFGELDLQYAHYNLPKEARKAKERDLRQWIKDFDNGLIVPDNEDAE